MKTESFNLNISALDDKVLYKAICKKIKESEVISFKLLWLVPVLSGFTIIGLMATAKYLNPWVALAAGLFGASFTYSIFRWEKRNMQNRQTFKEYAIVLEDKKMRLEESDILSAANGPFTLLSKTTKPHFWGRKASEKGWGKFEAVTAIYTLTIIFWLVMAVLCFGIGIN